jgi:hypothetical protein
MIFRSKRTTADLHNARTFSALNRRIEKAKIIKTERLKNAKFTVNQKNR